MNEFGYPEVGPIQYDGMGNDGATPYGVPGIVPVAVYVPVIWSALLAINYGFLVNVYTTTYAIES